jgi:hypothetical protein
LSRVFQREVRDALDNAAKGGFLTNGYAGGRLIADDVVYQESVERSEFTLDISKVDWDSLECCGGKRAMRSACRPWAEGMWIPAVHANCPHNEIAAFVKRTLAPLPDTVFAPVGPSVARCFKDIRRMAAHSGVVRWSYLQTAQSYSGRLRKRYLEAERSLRVDGRLTDDDSYLRPFLKAEKFNGVAKLAKPRLIYPRSPRYNLALAARLKPLEHWLWGYLTAPKVLKSGVGRVVAKGLNQTQRANLIVRKFKARNDCVAFEVDGSAFEAHVGPHQIVEEHLIYKAAFPGDRGLQFLLDKQLRLEGRLSSGIKFSRQGARASGDYNTGMGNTLVMLAVVGGVLRDLVPNQFDLLVDGDNAVVFLDRTALCRVLSDFAHEVVRQSGHEMVLEKPTSLIEEIRFGQSAPVYLGPNLGWRMVRDPRKVMSQALSSHRWLREESFAREWIRGVAACELSLGSGVPVLQSWALKLQAQWGGPEGVRAHPHTDYFFLGARMVGSEAAVPIHPDARDSFERAFGLDHSTQVDLERAEWTASVSNWLRLDLETFEDDAYPPGLIERYRDLSC